MLELAWSADEWARTRLAFSPLWEIVASVRVLARPGEHALHLPWVRKASGALADAGIDVTPLADLVAGRSVPRFLTPAPASPVPQLADELADLRDVAPRAVRRELAAMDPPPSAALARLHRDPEAGLDRLKTNTDGASTSPWPCGTPVAGTCRCATISAPSAQWTAGARSWNRSSAAPAASRRERCSTSPSSRARMRGHAGASATAQYRSISPGAARDLADPRGPAAGAALPGPRRRRPVGDRR
ncbi:hypothetical protein AB0K15_32340 [Amycolatopsis sp. NPDC049253]|uniref:hypothetical protein n=1 Tax=Amycolatopsis sp. NPDC049253 TaxID=3155274 RepID=UPI003432B309